VRKELRGKLKVVEFVLMAIVGLLASGLMILMKPEDIKAVVCSLMTAIIWVGYVKLLYKVS
jgi:hypothetical protein